MTVPRPDLSDSLVLDLEVDAICARFESAWQRGEHPDLDTELPAGGPLRGQALGELVRLDLEYRLKAGEPVQVDAYLSRYPELRADPARAAQLRSDEQRCQTQIAAERTLADLPTRARSASPGNSFPSPVCLEPTPVLGAGRDTVARTASTLSLPATQVGSQVDPRAVSSGLSGLLAPPQGPGEIGRLGNYRILEVLGEGGMGLVLRAVDPNLHREVALKVMKPAIAADENARGRFLREARAAARLEHERIVTIYQVDEVLVGASKVLYLAMPLLRGESLESLLQRQPRLPLLEVLRIGREIAEGLGVAHAAGLVHRDIKPANLWLRAAPAGAVGEPGAAATGGNVQILDFGLARLGEPSCVSSRAPEGELTQTGQVLGTPAYMAPEQAEGKPVDGRCDLFSLGCVLYRLTTGQMPFQGKNVMAILSSLAVHNPPPPSQLDPAVPEGLSGLVMRLLAKEPEARPGSAREVVEALRNLERGDTQAPSASAGTYKQAVGVETVGLQVGNTSTTQIPQRSDTGALSVKEKRDLNLGKPVRRRGLLIGAGVGVVGVVAVAMALWLFWTGKKPADGHDASPILHAGVGGPPALPGKDPTKEEPLTGKMDVRIWSNPPDRKRGLLIGRERNGAVPVCEDEMVMVEVSLNKPAYLYLLWIDAKGSVTPLYPWNTDKIEISSIKVAPSHQVPRQQLRNPPTDGKGWVIDDIKGLDTILLLANPTPLPEKVVLADLLGSLPAAPLCNLNEVSVRAFDRGKPVESLRLDIERVKQEAQRIDDQLLALVERLKDRFEVIRAVQFAHVPKPR